MTNPLLIAPKNFELFGLDIGTETIKAVQLRRQGPRIALGGYAIGELPAGTVKDGAIVEPEKLATAVNALLEHANVGPIRASYVSASLPASKIFSRVITVPKLKGKDLAAAATYELEQSVPQASEQLYTDFSIIGTYREGKETRHDVLVAAAPKAIVDSYLVFFQKLGRYPYALETELEAISRAMIVSHHSPKPILVADIGAETTDLSIVVGGSIRLTGSLPVGGQQFTEAIAAAFGVEPAKANETKIRYGLGDSGPAEKVRGALTPLIEQITTEIRRMLRFYQDRTPGGGSVSEVILSGGSSTLVGLREYVSEALGLPAQIGNPWENIAVGPEKPTSQISAPIYTTAVGLALGGLDGDY